MYLENKTKQENHSCENCRHNNICRWLDDMKMKQEEVSKIPLCKGLIPIRINITCESFERKPMRQDGVNFAQSYYHK